MTSNQRLLTVALTAGSGLLLLIVLGSNSFTGMLATVGAVLLILCGVGWWLADQARRLAQYTAWLGLGLSLLGILSLLQLPFLHALLILAAGLAVMLLAGFASIWRAHLPPGIQPPAADFLLALKVLLDELIMGYFITSLHIPRGRERMQVMDECRRALTVVRESGWSDAPASMHPDSEAPEHAQLVSARYKGYRYHKLFFDSRFPGLDLPGSERWLANTQQVRARVFEHGDGPRPWLVCVHGYRMGWLPVDFQLFSPGWLHHKLGFNLLMPILPLHGRRRLGWRSGDRLFDGNVMDMLHAIAQGVHDLRCLLAWLREDRQAGQIGMLGYSLGGLHASLVAGLESRLDSLIAGIPLVDIPTVMWGHSPRSLVQDFEDQGLDMEQLRELLRPVSPLVLTPQISPQRLGIAAAAADRLVPAEPVLQLAEHWQQSKPLWYAGSHLSVRRERIMREWLLEQWQNAGLLQTDLNGATQAG